MGVSIFGAVAGDKVMHQQFEWLNFLFEDIKDRMDGQDAAIATLQKGSHKESLMLEGMGDVILFQ